MLYSPVFSTGCGLGNLKSMFKVAIRKFVFALNAYNLNKLNEVIKI